MSGQYYRTRLKLTETPHETLRYAVLDGYSRVVTYCETEDQAVLLEHALNNYYSVEPPAQANEPRAIIRHFAAAQERKLAANDATKGGWRDYDWMLHYRALMTELGELLEAIQGLEDQERFGVEESEARENVLAEAADCSNYLMMLCDVIGALPPTDDRGR